MLGSVMVYLFCVGGAAFFAFFCATTVVVETAIVGTHHVATASKLGGSVWGRSDSGLRSALCRLWCSCCYLLLFLLAHHVTLLVLALDHWNAEQYGAPDRPYCLRI